MLSKKLRLKEMQVQKNFGSEKILGPKKCWIQKNFDTKGQVKKSDSTKCK